MAKVSKKCLQLAAQAWCKPETKGIEFDARLAGAFAEILQRAIRAKAKEAGR